MGITGHPPARQNGKRPCSSGACARGGLKHEKGAAILSAKMGGREVRKFSGGVSGGRSSRNWQMVDEPWFKPHRLLALPAGTAVIKHPRRIGRPLLRKLPFTGFTHANDYAPEAT